ncbi:MAG TPA: malate synthase A [Terracidiphilus sp.]
MTATITVPHIPGPFYESGPEILTPEAVEFLHALDARFGAARLGLLEARRPRQRAFDRGEFPSFLAETEQVRNDAWTVAAIPSELLDRRVELAGPPERRTVINALNSGAAVFVADFENANAPTWNNCIDGQRNLLDANRRSINWSSSDGRMYGLRPNPAVLFVCPRGWHMAEKHFLAAGAPISASLFDFGLYFFHNYRTLLDRGSAPYFYLPKLESHHEARLWNDVFVFAQQYVGIPPGTIRATVLIETVPAAFEMDEILYELRDHSAGLAWNRWDYLFSFIKKFRNRPECVLPQHCDLTMEQPFLRSLAELLIQTCHRRGIHAIGGMATQIPIRNDASANEEAMQRVRHEKVREVMAGYDGARVAHPGLVAGVRAVFDEYMPQDHQISMRPELQSQVTANQLLEIPRGWITESGLRRNLEVSLRYAESWLRGNGHVPIFNLMEDLASAEICRAQLWQWIRYHARLDDGRMITPELHERVLAETLEEICASMGVHAYAASNFERACELVMELSTGEFHEFLTSAAYGDLA